MKKFMRGAGAFLLSFWIPGLGQVLNSQLSLAAILFLVYLLIVISLGVFHLLFSFYSAVFSVLVLWSFEFAVALQAGRTAVRQVNANAVQKLRWPCYALATLFISIAIIPAMSKGFPERVLGIRAFKIPSDSMSPTIINGDHLMVNMRYYKSHRPKRGDLVVYLMPQFNVLYVKRVVAIGGDMIAVDSQGTILNGERIAEPYVYLDGNPNEEAKNFGPTTVPTNQVFLMGDNRNHSYDSRYTGTVGVDHVLGRPLYIYYSPGKLDRIGHNVE
jgi:signal peptidase I